MDLMDSRAVVEALRVPAVLVGQDLCAVAASPRWREAYGDAYRPFLADPFRAVPGAVATARGAIETALGAELAVPEVDRFEIRPVLARGGGRLSVVAGLLVVGAERPALAPRRASPAPGASLPSASPPVRSPSPPEPVDPAAIGRRLRTDLRDLVGHLDVLHASPLSRLQGEHVDHAIETALGLVAYLGEAGWAERVVEAPALRPPEARPLRALVVDDNSINRHVAQSMFGVLGVDTDAVGDAHSALAMLEATPYDLVFMDVMLPGVDGIEVTEEIRQRFGPLPYVVGVTAMPEAEARCRSAGMDGFVVKPLRLDDVSRAVALCDVA